MDTWFAPPQKIGEKELAAEIKAVSNNEFVNGLLRTVSGLLAIVDEHRQIVAVNDSFLKLLGVDDPWQALGLRPGEVLECVHGRQGPAGCGTTEYCSTCGAAIAIVTSLGEDVPAERICALTANRCGQMVDIVFLVHSQPISIEGKKFVLLFLQDITRQEQRAALERTFYHDVNNMLSVLVQASELMVYSNPTDLSKTVHQAAMRLLKEVGIQRCLAESSTSNYQPMWDEFSTTKVLHELKTFFAAHPAVNGKDIVFMEFEPITVKTDLSLLLRVLCNMIINALEATESNGRVKIWLERNGDFVSYCVWNAQQIPPEIAKKIYQRNFSTKSQAGRGVGTYSMKLFGEKILGGEVNFNSSHEDGTVFRFTQRLS